MGGTGLELPRKPSEKTGNSKNDCAESGALGARTDYFPPDLAAIVAVWPALSKDTQAAVLAIVQGAQPSEPEGSDE